MASQSSKSASSSTSSSISISKYDYDVFLSFCREDVGKSFADHLYAALVKKGLNPFREATSASESSMSIEKSKVQATSASESSMSIEKSKAVIVIFSRNYAHFTSLLSDLVEIIRHGEATGKPIIPVFYHVDPSVVRKQIDNYGEAFAEYESNHEKEKVNRWRYALTVAGNLGGYVLHHGR